MMTGSAAMAKLVPPISGLASGPKMKSVPACPYWSRLETPCDIPAITALPAGT